MTINEINEESLKAVHHAEESVYKAQSNPNMQMRQEAHLQLLVAKEKVHEASYQQNLSNAEQYRLHKAQEQLRHLSEAFQALED
jgi:hypothetical protein